MTQRHTPRPPADAYPTSTLTASPADTSSYSAGPGGTAGAGATGPPAVQPTAQAHAELARLHQAAHQICPGCGTAMVDRGCKLRCLRCGFFLDCSDG